MDIIKSPDAGSGEVKHGLSPLSAGDAWLLPDFLPAERLLDALAAVFRLDIAPEYETTVVYADSFDWRLYKQGCLLDCRDACWTLKHYGNGEAIAQQGGPELHTSCFAFDFPPGKLREFLEQVLGVRCLLPLATVCLRGSQIRLLNSDEKTVARVEIETRQPVDAEDERLYHIIRVFGVRGYDGEEESVRRILAENGVAVTVSPFTGFEEACRAKGRSPLDYDSKFTIELDGGETARSAMVRIYQILLDAITRNMPGVAADYDTEFLRIMRVAIRRTRSGLSLVKRVLPEPVEVRFSREFSRLGALTGPVRDLDVYLLAFEDCLTRLSHFLRPGIRDFFDGLKHKRQVEWKKLARALEAGKNKTALDAWQRVLKHSDRQPAELFDVPVRELAGRIILKRYKRVRRDGRLLDAVTPDAEVHRLRVKCKKLRYAIEFFGSLYPKQELQTLIRSLKKLQNILGRFNDLSVQQEMLRESLGSLSAGARGNLDQAAALGGLLQSLFQEQQGLRAHFAEAYAQFVDNKTTMLFNKLFNKESL